jgi:hypothetical protein
MGFVATLNLINPDVFIARQNLDRYVQTGDLDVVYLTSLSDDAVPQLVRGLNLTIGDTETQLTPVCSRAWTLDLDELDCYVTPHEILLTELNGRYQTLISDSSWQRWTSFNLVRWRASGLLGFLAD